MRYLHKLRQYFKNISTTTQMSLEIREGIANQSDILNRKLTEIRDLLRMQQGLPQLHEETLTINNGYQAPPGQARSVEEALRQHSLMFAHKTFNTSHPDYDATLARNFPGKVFNLDKAPGNPVYKELRKLIKGEEINDSQWNKILKASFEEAKTVPGADQVFERKAYVENYIRDLETKHKAFYRPGWVNLEDALFLYWVVRTLKPKTIVQTGVCNGLSSAFMMLALAKNGTDGTLHVIDMPPVYDSTDDNWKVPGKVYGVVIPEGKTSGWLVPDMYRDRFEVQNGDAKLLLPPLLQKLGKIDMFYHDSDHTYDHMMFEFKEAKSYLTPEGVIVSDDISWNASLWDFADQYLAPAYNYKGSMGVACF